MAIQQAAAAALDRIDLRTAIRERNIAAA